MQREATKEQVLNHVCLLLVYRDGKLMLEPSDSERFDGKVVKALSFKSDKEHECIEAFKKFHQKYNLNPLEKIKKCKSFYFEGKNFHVFTVEQSGSIAATGQFCFVKVRDLRKAADEIMVKGTGKCMIPEALKMAIN